MKRYDVIIFDFDNTLFDYEATERTALSATFEKLGFVYNSKYYDEFKKINRQIWANSENLGMSKNAIRVERFRMLFEELQISIEDITLSETASEIYIDQHRRGTLIEGVESTIKKLSEEYVLLIASSGLTIPRLDKLKNSPIESYFSKLFFREHFIEGAIKPDPRFFDTVLQEYLEIPRERILYVGDNFNDDVLGSKAAQLSNVWFDFFGLSRNGLDNEFDFSKCDHIIYRFDELLGVVENKIVGVS